VKLTLDRLGPYLAKSLGLSEEAMLGCFRPATRGDFEQVVALRRTLFTRTPRWNDNAYLRWRYDFSDDQSPVVNRFWIFKRGDEVLGGVGLERVSLVVDGEVMTAHKSMDIVVVPAIDGKGLGAWMNLALMERYPVILVVGSNQNSHKMLTRLFCELPGLQVWKLPISVRGTLKRRFRLGPLAAPLAFPVDLALKLRRKSKPVQCPSGIELQELTAVPADVDSYSKDSTRGSILVDRTAEYLTWRFFENPRRDYRLLGLYEKGALMGYSVYRVYRSEENDQIEAGILDWFTTEGLCSADGEKPKYGLILLRETVEHLVRKGACMIHVSASDEYSRKVLGGLEFRRRPEGSPLFVYCSQPELRNRLLDGESWFLTEGDEDTDGF